MKRIVPAAAAVLLMSGCAAAPEPTEEPDDVSGTITVFAAASLEDTFVAMADSFTLTHPDVEIVFNFGGSSGLATQITEGAPADVFAAANESTMQTVVEAGDAGSPVIFTTNTLRIVVPAGNPGAVDGLDDFADPTLAIALCDVEVPCGSAAQQVFEVAGVTPRPDTLEQDVTAVLTKVLLGEADAGLVYATDVRSAGDQVDGVDFPESADVVNLYPIARTTGSTNPEAAQAFIDYVLGDGQMVLADGGFVQP